MNFATIILLFFSKKGKTGAGINAFVYINCFRSSLRTLGTVGEPINPKAWQWYFDVVGDGRCPIVDTWWQTETGRKCYIVYTFIAIDL